jgi:hypothetical protein
MNLSPQEFAAWQRFQHRILKAEAWRENELRERLARDEIARLMRSLRCQGCGCPVVSCQCSDEDLPFVDPREVTG